MGGAVGIGRYRGIANDLVRGVDAGGFAVVASRQRAQVLGRTALAPEDSIGQVVVAGCRRIPGDIAHGVDGKGPAEVASRQRAQGLHPACPGSTGRHLAGGSCRGWSLSSRRSWPRR